MYRRLIGKKLHVLNLSHQVESCDLLGGYKPVDLEHLFVPLTEEFYTMLDTICSPNKMKELDRFRTGCRVCCGKRCAGFLSSIGNQKNRKASKIFFADLVAFAELPFVAE